MPRDPRYVQAAQLIKGGDKEAAKPLIAALLKEHPEEADYWYMAAMVTANRDQRIAALEKTLKLAPGHEKARKVLDRLKPTDDFDSLLKTETSQVKHFSPEESTQPGRPHRRLWRRVGLIIAMPVGILIGVGIFLIINPLRPAGPAEPPYEAVLPDEEVIGYMRAFCQYRDGSPTICANWAKKVAEERRRAAEICIDVVTQVNGADVMGSCLAGLGVTLLADPGDQQIEDFEMRITLSMWCESQYRTLGKDACSAWAGNTISAYREEVMMCGNLYPRFSDEESFGKCLQDKGIKTGA